MDISNMNRNELLDLLEKVAARLSELGEHACAFNILVVGTYEHMHMSQLLINNHMDVAHKNIGMLLDSIQEE